MLLSDPYCIPNLFCTKLLMCTLLTTWHCVHYCSDRALVADYNSHAVTHTRSLNLSFQVSTCVRWRPSASRRKGITLATMWLPSYPVVSLWSAATARTTPPSSTMTTGLIDPHLFSPWLPRLYLFTTLKYNVITICHTRCSRVSGQIPSVNDMFTSPLSITFLHTFISIHLQWFRSATIAFTGWQRCYVKVLFDVLHTSLVSLHLNASPLLPFLQ